MDLRELRKYHWEECLYMRKRARIMRERNNESVAKALDAVASKHMGFVQFLNDYFPIGDTAEGDCKNVDTAHS